MGWINIIGHERPKKFLTEAISRSQVAHAYLFFGEESIGKSLVAHEFSKALQCEGKTEFEACGTCPACEAIESGQHPDVIIIEPDGSQIKIDQIRGIQKMLMLKPYSGKKKILILNKAETMNLEAANSFLKTLEEPPDHTVILVVTSRPNRLPGTILSRCQKIRFDAPGSEAIADILINRGGLPKSDAKLFSKLCMGRIGIALSTDLPDLISQRDVSLSLVSGPALKNLDTLFKNAQTHAADYDVWLATLNWIEIWIRDLAVAATSDDTELLVNQDLKEEIINLGPMLPTSFLINLMEVINKFRLSIQRNLNRTMVLETILLELRSKFLEARA